MEWLKELGLNKYESSIYFVLLERGRLSGMELSGFSKVPPTAVYPALKKLIDKKLVQKFEGGVASFEAIEPKRAIKSYIEQKKREIEEIGNKAIDFSSKLEKKEITSKEKIMEVGIGRDFSNSIYYDVFEKAKKTIYILGWRFQKIGDKYNILNRLKKPIKKGVDVRLILIGEKDNKQKKLIRDYESAGVKIRYLHLEEFSLLIMDSKSCKITIKKKGNEKFSINILDNNLTDTMKDYYLTLWNRAEKI